MKEKFCIRPENDILASMFEIELKAWIRNFDAVLAATGSIAEYVETITKRDQYYRLTKTNDSYMTVRIRDEQIDSGKEFPVSRTTVTYKKKESRFTAEGVPFEVNEEHEFTVSNREEFELVLRDSGYVPSHSKCKIARGFQYDRFHIELCTIQGLGDFIEIETMSGTDNPAVVSQLQKQLEELIEQCGGNKSDIERRYYSDLLAEKASHTVQ